MSHSEPWCSKLQKQKKSGQQRMHDDTLFTSLKETAAIF